MAYKIIREDITKVKCDVIVNTANPKVAIGSGSDEAIYLAANPDKLLEARKEIGELPVGSLGVTPGFDLDVKYIFHISSPSYIDGNHQESEQLKQCYLTCLNKALELKVSSIAFPLLGTGNYHFSKKEGLSIALKAFEEFLFDHSLNIVLVLYDERSYQVAKRLFDDIEAFIDENYIEEKLSLLQEKAIRRPRRNSVRKEKKESSPYPYFEESIAYSDTSLEDFLHTEKTFQEKLFEIIDQKGLKDSEVYQHANVTKQTFSKIRSDKYYRPSKKTAFGLCISLHLSESEAIDLLQRANLTFSPSDKFDLVVQYFIRHQKDYTIDIIDEALYEHHLDTFYSK